MEALKPQLVLISLVTIFLFQTLSEPIESPLTESRLDRKHIVLVHGACLGAWSWYKLIPLLRSNGYNVTALDLAASGVDPRQITDIPSSSDYFKPLTDFMSSLSSQEKVVLVGHSLGGLALSLSMELFPEKIYVAVFLTALMPGPTYPISMLINNPVLTQMFFVPDNVYIFGDETNPTTFVFGPNYAESMVFPLSPVEDWILATQLVRKLRVYSDEDLSQVLNLTAENYGSVKRVFIKSGCDQVILPYLQNLMIEKNPPTSVEEIATSDHMVMMSRTQEHSDRLSEIAQSYH